ncbi:MAG: hypothetical protein ABSF60_05255 [Verrucomicrobiota bacterium]
MKILFVPTKYLLFEQLAKAESRMWERGGNNCVLLLNETRRTSYQLITFDEKQRPFEQEK